MDSTSALAIFIEIVVLPTFSPAPVTSIVLGGFDAEDNKINAPMDRNVSATGVALSGYIIIGISEESVFLWNGIILDVAILRPFSISSKFGIMPRVGRLTSFSMSLVSLTLLSKYSAKKANPIPPASPKIIDKRILKIILGLKGHFGYIALSRT